MHEVALESAPILKLDVAELDRLNLGDVIGSEDYAALPESFGDADLVTDADHHLFGVVEAPFPLAGEVEILPLIFAGKNEHGGAEPLGHLPFLAGPEAAGHFGVEGHHSPDLVMERVLELDAFGSKTREPGDAMVVLRYQAFAFQGLSNDRRGLARLSMDRAG